MLISGATGALGVAGGDVILNRSQRKKLDDARSELRLADLPWRPMRLPCPPVAFHDLPCAFHDLPCAIPAPFR